MSSSISKPEAIGEILDRIREQARAGHRISNTTAFVEEFARCEQHGRYPINTLDAQGVVRWTGRCCPICAKEESIRRLMARAEIDPRFQHCTLENFEATTTMQKTALEICRAYAESFAEVAATGRCLILRGNPGTGKNHLAVAITRRILEQGYVALHATAYEIVRRIRQTWRKDGGESEHDIVRAFGEVDLLVIDEVGRQYGSEAERVILFQVIDHRYRQRKPIVVISNQTREGIEAYLGTAAFDRLREDGGMLVNFDWQSHRGARVEKDGA